MWICLMGLRLFLLFSLSVAVGVCDESVLLKC